MGPTGKGHKSQSARDFVNFYNEVKSKKVDITNKEILKFSKLFEVINVFFTYFEIMDFYWRRCAADAVRCSGAVVCTLRYL
jgi:hypothetical protein